ncbi:putative 5-3 exonuclease [Suillus weaverae]|nr:putative 5-3 exonuclease [Suillus weaverae]
MNGIVHPCTHPEGKPAPETEEEMMLEVFKYTNRVVNMVRPRKLLFMAIDGVAPRAKMNQQRSRRFRTAQEAKDKAEARKLAVAEWEAMGKIITDDEKSKESWDSNAITPGTPFMALLTASLRYWVVEKMNTDPGWKDVRSEHFLGTLLIHFLYSFKSSSQMQVCLEKESIRLWTSYADNAQTPVMTLILDM